MTSIWRLSPTASIPFAGLTLNGLERNKNATNKILSHMLSSILQYEEQNQCQSKTFSKMTGVGKDPYKNCRRLWDIKNQFIFNKYNIFEVLRCTSMLKNCYIVSTKLCNRYVISSKCFCFPDYILKDPTCRKQKLQILSNLLVDCQGFLHLQNPFFRPC